MDVQTGKEKLVGADPLSGHWKTWSPDGRWVAQLYGEKNPHGSIGIFDFKKGGLFPLTEAEGSKYRPTFSLDGRFIAYCRWSSGEESAELWVTPTDGSKKEILLVAGIRHNPNRDMGNLMPAWHPSGDMIAYPNGEDGIWVIHLGGKRTVSE